jgi:hypothetical protein
MVYAFPPQVRFSGVSFSYNIGCAVVGGITPLLVSWLAHWNRFSPAHYVAAVAVFGFTATFAFANGKTLATEPATILAA